jgi:hypothetical protein
VCLRVWIAYVKKVGEASLMTAVAACVRVCNCVLGQQVHDRELYELKRRMHRLYRITRAHAPEAI